MCQVCKGMGSLGGVSGRQRDGVTGSSLGACQVCRGMGSLGVCRGMGSLGCVQRDGIARGILGLHWVGTKGCIGTAVAGEH